MHRIVCWFVGFRLALLHQIGDNIATSLLKQNNKSLMQELRGNVRVFTRVRPFLPSDKVPGDAEPVVVSMADGEGCILSTHVFDAGKDYGPVTHSFEVDKCFPPRCVSCLKCFIGLYLVILLIVFLL